MDVNKKLNLVIFSDNNIDRNLISAAFCGKELINPAELRDFEIRDFTFRDGLSLSLKFWLKPFHDYFENLPY